MVAGHPQLFVVGTSVDSHIKAVLTHLPRDITVCRLDVDRFPREQALTIVPGGGPRVVLEDREGRWVLDDCPIAWFRRLGQPGVDERLTDADRKWVLGEVEQTLTGALDLVRPNAWINDYWAARRSAVKLTQFQILIETGIPFAETVVSNNPGDIRAWKASHDRSVYKSLHSPMIDSGSPVRSREFVYTTTISDGDLAEDDSIRVSPCQFQRKLATCRELRVTTIGRTHIAVEIAHRKWGVDEPSDWRAHHPELVHSQIPCPPEVSAGIDRLMSKLGLVYGASDWICDDQGQWVLLEINPHGSWLWLEHDLPQLGISKAIADYIVARVRDTPSVARL